MLQVAETSVAPSRTIEGCRSCGSRCLSTFLDLGVTPLSDRLRTRQQLRENEPAFPLRVAFCSECGLVQITETVDPEILFANFPGNRDRQGITGHSMGGHGALTVGLKNPDTYKSISAFAPICSPVNCPWGQKALGNYLGADRSAWTDYDATELVRKLDALPSNKILVDQGMSDQFLEQELHPHLFEAACAEKAVVLELRRHDGYDHGYYFISTFMEDHLRHHAETLSA